MCGHPQGCTQPPATGRSVDISGDAGNGGFRGHVAILAVILAMSAVDRSVDGHRDARRRPTGAHVRPTLTAMASNPNMTPTGRSRTRRLGMIPAIICRTPLRPRFRFGSKRLRVNDDGEDGVDDDPTRLSGGTPDPSTGRPRQHDPDPQGGVERSERPLLFVRRAAPTSGTPPRR
jgi:hypothetical protein